MTDPWRRAGSSRGGPPGLTTFLPVSSMAGSAALVAEVAVLLAANGHRVLVLDRPGTDDGVLHCLRRLPAIPIALARLPLPLRTMLDRAFGLSVGSLVGAMDDNAGHRRRGTWWRYEMQSLPGRLEVLSLEPAADAVLDPAPDSATDQQIARLAAALRRDSPYDHVLLHGLGPAVRGTIDLVVPMTDTAVLTVAAMPDAVASAARIVKDLVGRADAPRVIAASINISGAVGDDAGGQDLVARAFSDLVTPPGEHSSVSVVDLVFNDGVPVGEALSVFLDADSLSGHSRRQVADLLVGGGDRIGGLPGPLRRHYANVLGDTVGADTYHLVYAPRDRSWADRVSWWLRDSGMRVRRFARDEPAPPGDTVLAITSPALARADELVAGIPDTAVAVVVERADNLLPGRRRIDLTRRRTWAGHRSELLGSLDLFVGDPDSHGTRKVLRSRSPRIPARDRRFVGREDVLERIRDAFLPIEGSEPGAERRPVVLVGEPGIGKSAVAAEYTHQFFDQYSGVVWVPAQDANSAQLALGEFARAMGLATTRGAAMAAVDRLRAGGPDERWLVVFDNVAADVLADLPMGDVTDVLITTTSGFRLESARTVEVERLPAHHSTAIVRDGVIGVPGLTDADATRVVNHIGGLPIPLKLAAACLADAVDRMQALRLDAVVARHTAVENLLEALGGDANRAAYAAGASPAGELSTAARIVGVSCQALAVDDPGRLAVRLAGMCAFLSADGVSLDLVGHRAFVTRLADSAGPAGDLLHADWLELDRVLALGSRFGLFAIDWRDPRRQAGVGMLRMHRVLQMAVREVVGPGREGMHADVLRALAEAAPLRSAPEDKAMAELQRHLLPCDAVRAASQPELAGHLGDPARPGSAAWNVRRWVVEQIAYLYQTGGQATWEFALALVSGVERDWTELFGPADRLRCRLVDLRGALLYRLDRFEEARAVDAAVLDLMLQELGPAHPRTMHSAENLAEDVLRLGRFDEALPESEMVWAGLRDLFGESHPQTLAKATNLAAVRFLNGRQAEALQLQRDSHRHRERLLGVNDPWFRESLRSLGYFLREVGVYGEAIAHLERALELSEDPDFPGEPLQRIRVRRTLGQTERRTGQRSADDLVAEAELLLPALEALVGRDHEEMLTALMAHAVNLAHAGRHQEADPVAERTVSGFAARAVGEARPMVGVALANRSVVRFLADDATTAIEIGRQALEELATTVDDVHPWWLAARNNLAGALARRGDAGVQQVLAEIEDLAEKYLPGGHPVATAIAANSERHHQQGAIRAGAGWVCLDIDPPLH